MANLATYCIYGLDHENFKDLKQEILCIISGEWKKRYRYFQSLGIELEDLVQGVVERLARIDRRIRKGEFDSTRATIKTWKGSQIKWAINDVIRNYQWSGSNYERVKTRAYTNGKEQKYVFEVWSEEQAEGMVIEGKYPAHQVEEIEARETLRAVLEILRSSCSIYVQGIFKEYFFRERTMKSISVDFDLTESRVCQIIKFVRNRLVKGLIVRGKTGSLSAKMIEDGYYRL